MDDIEKFHNQRFLRCKSWFEKCKQRNVKFSHRHLSRLKKQIDSEWKPNKAGALAAFNQILKFTHSDDVQMSRDCSEINQKNPLKEMIYHKSPLLMMIPKGEGLPGADIRIPL